MTDENNKPRHYPLEMIPVIHKLTEDMLKETQSQVPSLKNVEAGTEKIGSEMLARMIKTQIAQYQTADGYLEQCQQWRSEDLSKRQQQWVDEIAGTAQALQEANEEVEQLARLIEARA